MRGAPKLLVEHDIAALRAERHLHGIGEDVDAAQHAVAGVGGELTSLAAILLLLILSDLILRSAAQSGVA